MVGALGWVEVELEGRGHNCGFVCDGGYVTDSELRASPPAAACGRSQERPSSASRSRANRGITL